MKYKFEPDWRVPPGFTLREFMEEYNWTLTFVADALEVSNQWVEEFLVGDQPITPSIALKLENLTNVVADFWIRLQSAYNKPLSASS